MLAMQTLCSLLFMKAHTCTCKNYMGMIAIEASVMWIEILNSLLQCCFSKSFHLILATDFMKAVQYLCQMFFPFYCTERYTDASTRRKQCNKKGRIFCSAIVASQVRSHLLYGNCSWKNSTAWVTYVVFIVVQFNFILSPKKKAEWISKCPCCPLYLQHTDRYTELLLKTLWWERQAEYVTTGLAFLSIVWYRYCMRTSK